MKQLWLLLLMLLAAACGGPPPPSKPLDRLYMELAERREDFRVEALRGRTILIDPGHGGRFTGTSGREGLAEKDVNLGVALYLWGLLRDAGADAHLTRHSDRDFLLAGADSADVARDLAARLAIADSLEPDLFVSIHHNAAADTNRSRNGIETYYPLGEEGPSLDAARAIHAHLMRNLGIEKGDVRPGNFYVLRNNRFPAILGEPSYLSHPPVEEKLVLAEKRRLEAEAYFLGIVEYFQRGVPRAEVDSPADVVSSMDGLRLAGTVRDEGGEGIDPSTVQALLDGEPLMAFFDPGTGRATGALPPDLPPGEHRVALRARNLGGNAARGVERVFEVAFPPVRAEAEAMVPPSPVNGCIVIVRLVDERGMPIADGTPIIASPRPLDDGDSMIPGSWAHRTVNGSILLADTPERPCPDTIWVRVNGRVIPAPLPEERVERVPALLRIWTPGRDGGPTPSEIRILRDDGWTGVPRTFGWIPLDRSVDPEDRFFVYTPGYLPSWMSGGDFQVQMGAIHLVPLSDSPLRGKRVLIDPTGGSGGGVVPASARTLRLARDLEEMVGFAGGVPELTRSGEAVPDVGKRIALANRFGPDYWITIEYGDRYEVRHFPGSKEGAPFAEAVAEDMGYRLGADVPVRDGAEPVLRDTPCPAIVVTLPMDMGEGRPARARMRATAQAIQTALADRLDPDPPMRGLLQIDLPFPHAQVRIDDAVTFQDHGAAVWRIGSIPAGRHLVRLETEEGWTEHFLDIPPYKTTVLFKR
ncbi:MAG: N-acetylmuramoyl-L-alanine amidase [Candidatus Eisenbacteria bacterium]